MKPIPEQYATLEKIQRATRSKEEHERIKKCGTKADIKGLCNANYYKKRV